MKTIYVSIGNSDDKLTQKDWASFLSCIDLIIQRFADEVHGSWVSLSTSEFQNACWCFELETESVNKRTGKTFEEEVREKLVVSATEFKQESITWAEVPTVEFLLTVHHPATAILDKQEKQ